MLTEFLELNVFGFFLVFARVGSAIALMPGFSSTFVSPRFALAMGMAISFVVMPVVVSELPVMPANVTAMALLIAGEILIGAFFGSVSRILVSTLQTAGTIIAYTSSLANAMINDAVSEQQSSTISSLLMTMGLVLIFVTDMHHLMLTAVIDSYSLFIPGQGLMVEDFANFMTRKVADSFALALQLSSPFVIVGLTYYIGLGLLGRLMPQLQVFFFGMPFQLALQIWVLVITISGIMMVFMTYFAEGQRSFLL